LGQGRSGQVHGVTDKMEHSTNWTAQAASLRYIADLLCLALKKLGKLCPKLRRDTVAGVFKRLAEIVALAASTPNVADSALAAQFCLRIGIPVITVHERGLSERNDRGRDYERDHQDCLGCFDHILVLRKESGDTGPGRPAVRPLRLRAARTG